MSATHIGIATGAVIPDSLAILSHFAEWVPRRSMARSKSNMAGGSFTVWQLGSGVARQFIALEDKDHALGDIDERRGGGLGDADNGHQAAAGAAMRGRDDVAGQALVPDAHARRDQLVALALGRLVAAVVVLARGVALRVAVVQLGDGHA